MAPRKKQPVGRPTVMTEEVVAKLEEVFALGGTDIEACFYAGISRDALYEYQTKHPEFTDRKEALKETPVLKARRTVVNALDNPAQANWYLERKKKAEFAARTEHTGSDGNPLVISFDHSFEAPSETADGR